MRFVAMFVGIFVIVGATYGQTPAVAGQSKSHGEMIHRGNQVMGFSAEKTAHHFRLFSDGGTIEVSANDPKDTQSRDQIRMHLSHIASMFSEGNFNTPVLVHHTTPPGVATITKLCVDIRYEYEEAPRGARIRIRTQNPSALDAIQAFLLFQIIEHRTGDSASIAPAFGTTPGHSP